jgi:alanine-alpha-ketoisovalerate/valine-pyruvate aminotransferase
MSFNQKIKTWYQNQPSEQESKTEDAPKYVKKWNTRLVMREKMSKEIDSRTVKLSGETGGNPGYIKHYNKAWNEVFASLGSEKLAEYSALAEFWNTQGADLAVKRRHVYLSVPIFMI